MPIYDKDIGETGRNFLESVLALSVECRCCKYPSAFKNKTIFIIEMYSAEILQNHAKTSAQ